MGEKADLQGQKLYVMLFMLSFVYWIGERYLNLETAKDMMFWERGSIFVSTEKENFIKMANLSRELSLYLAGEF